MSHIHIPDGVLPLWLVIAGWVVTLGILSFCVKRVRGVSLGQKLPLIGVVSALMIVGMTLEIVPIAYHINLSVIAGIVLGPALGFIAVFIVDLIVAMFGHGGITAVGLNTLIVGAEVVLGFYLFRALRNSKLSAGPSAALATVFSLILSTSLMIGVVYVSEINAEKIPYIDKKHKEEITSPVLDEGEAVITNRVNIGAFAKMVFFLGAFGWILEAVITGFVIRYVSRVRPDLILSKVKVTT
jgi:cobalt/nickel transport system permease protein